MLSACSKVRFIFRCKGLTLIELMVVLALVVAALTLGVPTFQGLVRNQHLATGINEWVAAAQLARSEAIKRGVRVTLCKSEGGANCTHKSGYERGWIVFSDPNNNATVDAGEEIIGVFREIAGNSGMTLTGNSPVANYISYTADGVTRLISGAFQAGTLTACMAPKARQIVINSVGRIKVVESMCL
ncbi:putative type-4 fimbrial pilin related signal peptide protein [Candidatus Competibacter denitrificans Run_A_D11]|uniref:Type II secretion system protein H n=1 Tax=Candidatus Competibacter denitrificans Run_A_D11 TaxID=1400863 RepID=W6M8D8_9GAMM|nr:GspH/FimT family pseudopilin [Candidatus Competibacter denitrificans]CDI03862.1 putative type-4 fimbrial pilin related signal peptide protein [Candidatus Competibacter denitrificans Run_A_D11]HRC69389.1 GspH/FimT family pseudopilin [Candidatus Competibacter denitrificans]